jgi:hypothetical protein
MSTPGTAQIPANLPPRPARDRGSWAILARFPLLLGASQ